MKHCKKWVEQIIVLEVLLLKIKPEIFMFKTSFSRLFPIFHNSGHLKLISNIVDALHDSAKSTMQFNNIWNCDVTIFRIVYNKLSLHVISNGYVAM